MPNENQNNQAAQPAQAQQANPVLQNATFVDGGIIWGAQAAGHYAMRSEGWSKKKKTYLDVLVPPQAQNLSITYSGSASAEPPDYIMSCPLEFPWVDFHKMGFRRITFDPDLKVSPWDVSIGAGSDYVSINSDYLYYSYNDEIGMPVSRWLVDRGPGYDLLRHIKSPAWGLIQPRSFPRVHGLMPRET